jgi:hypothetical protein
LKAKKSISVLIPRSREVLGDGAEGRDGKRKKEKVILIN